MDRHSRNSLVRDALTGLYNRRHLLEMLRTQAARAERYGETFGIMLIDVDNFKSINDRFSHDLGDQVLQTLAALFRESLRSLDTVARYGGEEFVVLCPHIELEGLRNIAERLRTGVMSYPCQDLQRGLQVTLSIGLALGDTDKTSAKELLKTADKYLYEAKRQGWNQVCS